jgi:hypothetical protein
MVKIFILLIAGLSWAAPDARAFFTDNGQESEEPTMIQEMIHKKAYHATVEERRQKSREAAPLREKRMATMTPFVQETPQEPTGITRQKTKSRKKDPAPKSPPTVSSSPPATQADIGRQITGSIFANFLVILACFIGMILVARHLRPKK